MVTATNPETVMVQFGLLLIRRFGLAVGAWMVAYAAVSIISYLQFLSRPGSNSWDPNNPVPRATMLAWGAAIFAFFAPRLGAARKTED
jgi:hypothetical protein